jgi:predicted acetyltransferase
MPDLPRPEIRVERATDAARYLALDKLTWFDGHESLPLEVQLLGVPEDQRFAAEVVGADPDPATYAGIYGVRPLQLSVPDGAGAGRAVPAAGLTWVGVHPDQHRRGVLTAMMRHHFVQTRSEGVDVSVLHASEPVIYGRHGYGIGSVEQEVQVSRGTTFTAPHLDDEAAAITTRLSTITDEGVPERRRRIDLDLLSLSVGTVAGSSDFYLDISRVTPEEIRTSEPPRLLVATLEGRDVGYVSFKRTHKWTNSRPAAEVDVRQLAGTPAARLALLRRVVDLDLAGTITLHGISLADPLFAWVDGPRGVGAITPFDSLWVRLVDLPRAIAARGYEATCDVVVDVSDVAAPWNAGRWRIRVKDGVGEAAPTDDEPELSLAASALGSAYLGGGNLVELRRAGVIAEHRSGAVNDLWRAFRTDVGPDTARGF